ncbi:NAD(P)/FAD-dependent oxidoreductase [Hamadaea tsunoensis]|uniref:NAD(P)/FAD-dependent oxidoreductase n=1 Tax=Hamadaea tsunoensis TaxID=53368 RepID=UPI0005553E4A|nr:FAD-dependent oxidoreductase [Hamadaea tsunoensis]
MTNPSVIIVGGGYGGITVAKALDEVADVTLIEPRDAFVHNVATLRAVVDPAWAGQLFIPYDGLLTRGRVRRDRAVEVHPGSVRLASGDVLQADYLVLATGTAYPFPAKLDSDDRATGARRFAEAYKTLAAADRVLLLGAGPVGLEFAGEIKAAWPGTAVTVVDPADEPLGPGFPAEVRAELRRQLAELGVDLVLGTSLRELPPTEPGAAAEFTATTLSGVDITADVWFPCYGAVTASAYLAGELAAVRRPNGQVAVTPQLRVTGQETVFAVGDITDVPELKMARLAQFHAAVVADNIRALIEGREATAVYEPTPDAIVLPLGPHGGVSYAPEAGLLDAATTAHIKKTFYIERYRELLGAD